MKSFLLACIAMLSMGYGAVHEDVNIRTWVVPMTGINLNTETYVARWATPPAGFAYDKVVGVKTLVYSDPKPGNGGKEVFNLIRQSGIRPNPDRTDSESSKRSGGWSHFFAIDPQYQYFWPEKLYIELNRSGSEDFYSANFPRLLAGSTQMRTFTDPTQKRGSVKLEYVCRTCPASSTHVIWRKIGPWQMERDKPNNKRSLQIDLAPYGIPPLNIVDMTAAIHSDPSSGSILVDDLEHTGRRSVGNLYGQNFLRGGILWYGYGCISSAVGGKDCDGFTGDPGFYRLRLYGGPTLKPGSGNIPHSTYSNGGYEIFSPTGTTTRVDVPYFSSTQNRGWVRIEYTGTKSSVAVPYAVKSKAMDIGTWNMTVEPYMKELRFSDLGIAANRVTRLATVIRSDHFTNCLSRCFPGHEYKNFHAPLTSGRPSEKNLGFGGGNTFIDESKNYSDGSKGIIGLYLSSQDSKFSDPNGVYTGSGNRGSVLVDYLAGSCENGISGFNIQAIPGTYIGACGTTATTFDFEGSGSDVWNSADDFTYMSKIGSNDKDLVIRVDAQNAGDGWARTGIMIRESQAPGARHASIFVTPSNGIRFTYRNYNNQPTTHSGANSLKAPYFLRLQKSGTTFTASVRPNTSSSWTTIGTKPISGFPSTNYYYGLAQTSKKTTLAKSTFSNRSGF